MVKQNTMKTKTHYLLVLDQSGSMQSSWDSTRLAVQSQFESLHATQLEFPEVPIEVTFVTFESSYHPHFMSKKTTEIQHLDWGAIYPKELTALLDAIGRSLNELSHLVKEEEDVVCMIFTDGGENASKEFSYENIRELIESKKKAGWQFNMIGADFDAWTEGSKIGLMQEEVHQYKKSEIPKMMKTFSSAFHDYSEEKSSETTTRFSKFKF